MQKEIHINGTNRTSLFTKYGYAVGYKKIRGRNGGTMLDGSTTEDIIAIKAVVTLPLMPLSEEQLNELIADIYGGDYVTLYYFDIRTNAYIEAEFMYSEITGRHIMQNAFDTEMWLAGSLTLTER